MGPFVGCLLHIGTRPSAYSTCSVQDFADTNLFMIADASQCQCCVMRVVLIRSV